MAFTLALCLAFAWGLMAGVHGIFPYPQLRAVKNAVDAHEGPPINASYQSNAKVPLIAPGLEIWGSAARVVMVGDSITAQGQWNEMFPELSILNRGIGGDTAGGVADRAALIARMRPERVFLMVGLNDLFYPANSEPQILAQFERAITRLSHGSTRLFVQSIIVCNRTNPVCTGPRQVKLARFNRALERLSAKHGATYIDLNREMSGPQGLREELSWDGMHLNGEGYRVWRDILRPYMGEPLAA